VIGCYSIGMKLYVSFLLLTIAGTVASSQSLDVKWIHGSESCASNTEPDFQIHAYDENTIILRENKCINYEGPFIYLLFGSDKVLMQDTGAAPAPSSSAPFPIAETVKRVVIDWGKKHNKASMPLVITHSHSHGDHIGGDSQFKNQPNVTLVGTKPEDVQAFFGIRDWPNGQSTFDLGGRILDILPIPGHEPSSIAIYDRNTKLLLTGDTVYPGRLYIRDWPAFKASIGRLAAFIQSHEVSHVMGTHIEMTSTPGVDYPIGSTFQPKEHSLELKPSHLIALYSATEAMTDKPVREVHNDFIIYPR